MYGWVGTRNVIIDPTETARKNWVRMWCLATSTTAPGCFMFGMQYDHQEDISKTQILKLIRAEILANFKLIEKKLRKTFLCVTC